MLGSHTSPKRQRVNILELIHSLALRACILDGYRKRGAVQPCQKIAITLADLCDQSVHPALNLQSIGE
jgi:hypothetical protein